jgi:hypothetical protein
LEVNTFNIFLTQSCIKLNLETTFERRNKYDIKIFNRCTLIFILAACTSSGQSTSASKTSSEVRQQSNTKPSAGTTSGKNLENAVNSVVISGGFNTDPQDKGRPVVLIAAALGVPTEVFREAFRGVTPAGVGSGGPSTEQAQKNKSALLKVRRMFSMNVRYGSMTGQARLVDDYIVGSPYPLVFYKQYNRDLAQDYSVSHLNRKSYSLRANYTINDLNEQSLRA